MHGGIGGLTARRALDICHVVAVMLIGALLVYVNSGIDISAGTGIGVFLEGLRKLASGECFSPAQRWRESTWLPFIRDTTGGVCADFRSLFDFTNPMRTISAVTGAIVMCLYLPLYALRIERFMALWLAVQTIPESQYAPGEYERLQARFVNAQLSLTGIMNRHMRLRNIDPNDMPVLAIRGTNALLGDNALHAHQNGGTRKRR